MLITIRTDASLQIGTGHVMRCLTLADKLRKHGARCRFICREHPGNLLEFIRERDFEAIALPFDETYKHFSAEVDPQPLEHSAWLSTDWLTDAKQTKAVFGETAVDWLIVDHYALDTRWESFMRGRCKRIMVIDDIADRQHNCDLLLDQNLFVDMAERYKRKVPTHCSQLLGPDYALLQPHYADLHSRIPPREGRIGRILVYFGGADANHLTGLAVAAYQAMGREDIVMDVVVNSTNPHVDSLRHQVASDNNILLHVDLPSLAPLMAQADLAIGAGGATSWERCCMGLPALVISLAANQTAIASELDRKGFIRWLGDAKEVSESSLLEAVKDICTEGFAVDWSKRCQHLVDGQGAGRVASILMLEAKAKFQARLARVDDEELLLNWANNSLVRRNSFASNQIDRSSYHIWFYKCLRDLDGCRIFIIETEDGVPIGQVHFHLIDNRWNIDYSVEEVARGFSLGALVVSTAIQAFRLSMLGALLFRRVKLIKGAFYRVSERLKFRAENVKDGSGRLSIAVCSDEGSWINAYLPKMLQTWLEEGHSVAWSHDANELPEGDICFYLSYGKIVDVSIRSRFKNNLVVHESDLPKGRGWSPMTYLILEGKKRIPVSLIEAVDQVDAGVIYLQDWIDLRGDELGDEWRQLQANGTLKICHNFVSDYPSILTKAQRQKGEASIYPRRLPSDSELDPNISISEQINMFRVADNKRYPVFFIFMGKKFVLQVESKQTTISNE